jgi:DnaK suppressor protein
MAVLYERLRSELEQHRDRLKSELGEAGARSENGMGYSTHQADDASLAYDQAADLAMRRNAERLLYQVERALHRMEEGTYGVCRNCGQPIDVARLKAIPYARYCIDCAARYSERD